jgi:6,7-dimethyl-8-ribityllumazine synthase
MSKTIQGKLDATGLKIALVVSRFNEFITSRLLAGARDALVRHGASADNLTEVWVPGSWELPVAAKALATSGRYDALVCLGCVIRGETTHYLHVGGEAARGIAQAALETGVPIGFGVLTTDTLEQAVERAGSKGGNKGADAALAAVETANLLREIGGPPRPAR